MVMYSLCYLSKLVKDRLLLWSGRNGPRPFVMEKRSLARRSQNVNAVSHRPSLYDETRVQAPAKCCQDLLVDVPWQFESSRLLVRKKHTERHGFLGILTHRS